MAKGFKEYFVAERAKALATMYLTRRDDLVIRDTKEDLGLDYLVHIVRKDEPAGRPFGILLRAVMSPVTLEHANQVLKPAVQGFQRLGDFLYPVCLFFFTMRDDKGYSTWLLEPVVTKAGKPKLATRAEPDCQPLTPESLNQIVSAINAWYDALYADLTA